jgi:hypothetical protein
MIAPGAIVFEVTASAVSAFGFGAFGFGAMRVLAAEMTALSGLLVLTLLDPGAMIAVAGAGARWLVVFESAGSLSQPNPEVAVASIIKRNRIDLSSNRNASKRTLQRVDRSTSRAIE